MASTHTVESTPDTVRSGYLDPAAKPVATILPGDNVSYPHTWTHWGNEATFGMSFADREPLRHRYPRGPYSMLGPVAVAGAEPGDVIECSITRLRTIDWGWNSFPLGVGALPNDFTEPYVHYPIREPDRLGLQFHPAQGGARRHREGHLPGGNPGPDNRVAAAGGTQA